MQNLIKFYVFMVVGFISAIAYAAWNENPLSIASGRIKYDIDDSKLKYSEDNGETYNTFIGSNSTGTTSLTDLYVSGYTGLGVVPSAAARLAVNGALNVTGSGDATFGTSGVPINTTFNGKVTVAGAGNVGIGTTSPAEILDIVGKIQQNLLKLNRASASTVDDGTIVLATGVAGLVNVWTEAEYMQVYVDTAGVCTLIYGSTNTAVADTDTKLCVYDGGTGAIIKNRLGATKTVRYAYQYS